MCYTLPLNIHASILEHLYCRWKKTYDKRKFIVERHDFRLLTVQYLRAIKAYREEGRPIVYANETYIYSSHTTSHAWDDGLVGLKAPLYKGRRLIIVHTLNSCTKHTHLTVQITVS